MQALVVGHVGHGHAQLVVEVAAHQMAFQHLRTGGHGTLEGVERRVPLIGQRDLDEHRAAPADGRAIEAGRIALDHPAALQALQAAQAGRGTERHGLRQLGVGKPPVALQ